MVKFNQKIFPKNAERITSCQWSELSKIIPSNDEFGVRYYPCRVILKTGAKFENVCFVEATQFIETWGEHERDDLLPISSVLAISESNFRLPLELANELYKAGESGMGYTLFQLGYSDGTISSHSAGNLIDFVLLPKGKTLTDIVEATPHVGREERHLKMPNYLWCPFYACD